MKRAATVLGLVVMTACSGADNGHLSVSFEVSGLTGPQGDGEVVIPESFGLYSLDPAARPIFIRLVVEADDLDRPPTASWPGADDDPEVSEVTLDLEVPPGVDRRIFVSVIIAGDEATTTYSDPGPGADPNTFDIGAGEERELVLAPVEVPEGTVTLRWDPAVEVTSVAWVDEQNKVALPLLYPEENSQVTSRLAINRSYWPLVELDGGFVDLSRQTVSLEREGQLRVVDLEL